MDQETLVKILSGMEKVSSFAATVYPLFNIVTAVVKVAKGLVAEDPTQDQDAEMFIDIHANLESISKKNQQILNQIHLDEVNEKYSKYEYYIKHQYSAFNSMVEQIKKDPEGREGYMKHFQEVCEVDKCDIPLNTFYSSVVEEEQATFEQKGLLKVYLENYKENKVAMENKCTELAGIFYMGLMSRMAYKVVKGHDEDAFKEEWFPKVVKIQAKMNEALAQCTGTDPHLLPESD